MAGCWRQGFPVTFKVNVHEFSKNLYVVNEAFSGIFFLHSA